MRVVCDTNVIVSSFLSPLGTPAKIVSLWENHHFDLLVSEAILLEYKKALSYQHVQRFHHMSNAEIQEIIDNFRIFAIAIAPKEKREVIKEDPDDNKFLECAQEGNAAYIISGDLDLLRMGSYSDIQILTPAAFLAVLERL